jgi:antitoxin component of RelBE/YafQ-DinJ toxin-antitoxin module
MRPNIHDRVNQPYIRFRTDELTKERFQRMCQDKGLSAQEYLEVLIKDKLFEHDMKKERVYS